MHPLRPAAYGKPIQDAYFPIPYRDDQSAVAFQELGQISQMANMVNGQNQARQGQFVKGNKTLREYENVMANANGRDQMTAMLLEAQVFTPMKEIIKINTMQYQAGISIFSPTQKRVVQIDPVALRKAFATYTLTDGLTPTDKVISGDDLTVALQTMGSSPQIGSGYNLAPAFSYLLKTRNVDLKPFEKTPAQIAYEQALMQWQNMAAQVTELAKSVTMKVEGVTLEQIKEMVKELTPPQPKPQDYGYNPEGQSPGAGQGTGSANLSQAAQATT